jgi:hypothetical protein
MKKTTFCKTIVSAALLFISILATAQNTYENQTPTSSVPKMELQVAYFGELGFHPGGKIGVNYYFYQREKHKQHRSLTNSFNMGVGLNLTYFHLPKYTNNFMLGPELKFNFTHDKRRKNGSIFSTFTEMNLGVSLFQSYLKGDVYSTTANNGFEKKRFKANTSIAPTFNIAFGTSLPQFKRPTKWYLGVDVAAEFSSNKYSFPITAATLGIKTVLSK